jgi:hypothetical protein
VWFFQTSFYHSSTLSPVLLCGVFLQWIVASLFTQINLNQCLLRNGWIVWFQWFRVLGNFHSVFLESMPNIMRFPIFNSVHKRR